MSLSLSFSHFRVNEHLVAPLIMGTRSAARFVVGLATLLWILLLISSTASAQETPSSVSCPADPPACSCERNSDGQWIINCRQGDLDAVPVFRQSDVVWRELTLANNYISAIGPNAFSGLRIKRLDLTADISDDTGGIMTFDPQAFGGGLEEHLEELLVSVHPSSSFPPVAALARLTTLSIEGFMRSRLSSTLPVEALASLTNLVSLSLTYGSLTGLKAEDVSLQSSTLAFVDLSYNQLSTVPTSALMTLSNLTSIDLSSNNIGSIDANSFSLHPSASVQAISLSYNPLTKLDPDAFGGNLPSTLWNLSMSFCKQLTDSARQAALKPLSNLRNLNLASSNLNSIDGFIGGMGRLETLDARNNNITSLTTLTRRSSSLRVLNLGGNNLTSVPDNTFLSLTALEELTLDDARGLQLSDMTFIGQRQTLRMLSIRRATLYNPEMIWSALSGLSALQMLYMSGCSLEGAIPDFTFVKSTQLNTLDLSNNGIDTLTPRSLAGLQDSLTVVKLNSNKLTTLDRCVFYGFTKLSVLKVYLNNNPLECDCRLQWLYIRVVNASMSEFDYLNWRCSDGRTFNQINASVDFAGCSDAGAAATTPSPCEDFRPTTIIPITGVTDQKDVVVVYVNVSSAVTTSVYVFWSISGAVDVASIAVTCRAAGSPQNPLRRYEVEQLPPPRVGSFVATDLEPGTVYYVCVEVTTASYGTLDPRCLVAVTPVAPRPAGAGLDVILGVAIGGGLALLLLIVVVVVCCCCVRRRPKDPVSPDNIREPKRSVQTKRFRKQRASGEGVPRDSGTAEQGDPYGTRLVTQADVDKAIIDTVERLDPQSKGILANLLRSASAASLDRDGGPYPRPSNYFRSTNGRFEDDRPWTPGVGSEKHIYETLPGDDDTYDVIPTDDTV